MSSGLEAAESSRPDSSKIPGLSKLGYGFGNIAYSLPYQASATFFMFFATEIVGIPPTLAGTLAAVSLAWDAVCDPLVGYLSDNTESRRLGRRHPYLLAGGVLTAVLTCLLWTVSSLVSFGYRVALVFLFLVGLRTALAIFVIPYLALGGELSRDYDERSAIQGVRAAFYLTGMILAIAGATLVFFRATPAFPRGQLNPAAYPRMALAFAAVVLVSTAVCVLSTWRFIPLLPGRTARMKGRPLSAKHLFGDFLDALRDRELLALLLMIVVIEAGFQFGIAIGIHVNTYTYGLTGPQIGLLTLAVLGSSVLSQPFWVWFAKRFEKRVALIAGLLIGFAGFVGAPWAHVWWKLFPLESPGLLRTLAPFMVLAGIGNGAFMSIPNSMIADAADVEELATGKRDEGLYFGLYIFAYKVGVMVSLLLSGFALSRIGFRPGAPGQTEATRFLLAMVPTYLLLASAPFALFFISKYGITRQRWRQVKDQLQERRAYARPAGDGAIRGPGS